MATRRSTRLDCVLCDEEWMRAFPEATLTRLYHSHSDHMPILLQTAGQSSNDLGRRPFRFQATWMTHGDFDRIIHDKWTTEGSIVESLKSISLCRVGTSMY